MWIWDKLIWLITHAQTFASNWGYLGIFLVSLLASSSILLPFPSFIVIFSLGAVYNPFFVALSGALGASIGNVTSYVLGLGGKEILEKRYEKKLIKIRETFGKYGAPLWITIVNATPFPDDLVGIFCGIIKYDFKKYFLAMFLGQFILALILAYSGFYSLTWILDFLQPRLGF